MTEIANPRCDISVIVPSFNEADSIPELLDRIHASITGMGRTYEVWIVDDGSTDGTFAAAAAVAGRRAEAHAIQFTRNHGKAAALQAGFDAAAGDIVITMDADLQDDPAEIPDLVARIEQGWDLVSGWKQDRKDSFIKNQTSKIFNGVTSLATGLRLHDFNCGLKAYRREVIETVKVYGEMHRYIPALAHREGFRVTEMPVRHHKRTHGITKYGPARFINGFLDLMTLMFLSGRASSPLHLFGRIGVFSFAVGAVIDLYFLGLWLAGHGLRLRPLLLLGVVLVLLAVQFISLGLIAELVVAGRHPEQEYRVRRRI